MLQIFGQQLHGDYRRCGSLVPVLNWSEMYGSDRQAGRSMQCAPASGSRGGTMRRYYFDVRDGDELHTDNDGRDFSSFEDVQKDTHPDPG